MLIHPASPGLLYQQNHVGTYRSDDYGDTWYRIDKGLPYDYGFGIALNPRNADTCYVVPLEPEEYAWRVTPGKFRVYKSSNKCKSWTELASGLPSENAHMGVLREGMANDNLKPCGVYVGTSTGHLFYSSDAGDSWKSLAQYLPPILSVSVAVL